MGFFIRVFLLKEYFNKFLYQKISIKVLVKLIVFESFQLLNDILTRK